MKKKGQLITVYDWDYYYPWMRRSGISSCFTDRSMVPSYILGWLEAM